MISEKDAIQFHRLIHEALGSNDLATAESYIQKLILEGEDEVKAQAYWQRAQIKERLSDIEGAKQCYLEGLKYRAAGTFGMHDLELLIAQACQRLGDRTGAIEWYRKSMQTCREGGNFGCMALFPCLEFVGDSIPSEDAALVAKLVTQSWSVVGVPGEPDLSDLPHGIRTIDNFIADQAARVIGER